MAEDFDVEAMLEAPFRKIKEEDEDDWKSCSNDENEKRRHRSRTRSKSRLKEENNKERSSKDDGRERGRNRSRDKDRHKSDYRRSKSRNRKRRSLSRNDRSNKYSSRHGSHFKEKRRSNSRDRKLSPARDRYGANRSKHRSRSKEIDRKRSNSRDRKFSPVRERYNRGNSRSKDWDQRRRHSFSPRPFRRGRSPPANYLGNRSPRAELSPEEKDARTVLCMQLSQRIRTRDLEEFFSSVGKVRDVRLITCNKTKRFKGIAYIEFKDPESVALALGLSGQRLLGIPISVQHSQAEKNRIANSVPTFTPKPHTGPMRLYVGSLHFNITEEMLRGIFEPFGKIDSIQLIMDTETGRSKGYGFITYHNAEDAKKALEQLNGFELAGRPIKVGNVTERLDMNTTSLDTDEMDRSGIDLGATGRLQLMFKLAEGAGLAVPQAAANALLATAPQPTPIETHSPTPSVATQCFMLTNMFDPNAESNTSWDSEIKDDVIDECTKHGGVLHIYVDKKSLTGNVYVKCPSITTAVLAVNSLHGRWFAGRLITATYVPLLNYHSLFPDAVSAVKLLSSARK